MHAESKAAAIFCLILAVSLDPALPLWRIGVYLLYLTGLAVVFQVSIIRVFRRSLTFLPFVLVVIFFGVLPSGSPERAALLTQRAFLAAFGLALLGAGNDFPGLLKGLHRLGLPGRFVLLLSFMYRYLELLLSEAKRMETARNQRYFGGRLIQQFRVMGNIIGSLFLRTYERGERVYQAMVLRGYAGVSAAEPVTYSLLDKVVLGSGVGILLLLAGTEIIWRF